MIKSTKTLEFSFERTIPAPPEEVYDAWLDASVPGTTWNAADKFILDPKVDGLFFWRMTGNSHYGRFTKVERPGRMQYTWVSSSTLGEESLVTVTFKKKGENTLMTLVHSGLPDNDCGRRHEMGWNYFLGIFTEKYGQRPAKRGKYRSAGCGDSRKP